MNRIETNLNATTPSRPSRWLRGAALALLAVLVVFSGLAMFAQGAQQAPLSQDAGTLDKEKAAKVFPAKAPYSPYAGRNYPSRPYFGDTHLHTSFSMDAGAAGARLTPADRTGSLAEKRSWPRAVSRSGCPARSTS